MLHRRNSFSDIANLVENKFWDTMDKTSLTKSTLLYTILNHDTAPTWHFPNPRGSFKKKVLNTVVLQFDAMIHHVSKWS